MGSWRALLIVVLCGGCSAHQSPSGITFPGEIKDESFKASVNDFVSTIRKSAHENGVYGALCEEFGILQKAGERLQEDNDLNTIQYYEDRNIVVYFKRVRPGFKTQVTYVGAKLDSMFAGANTSETIKTELEKIEKSLGEPESYRRSPTGSKALVVFVHNIGLPGGSMTNDDTALVEARLSSLNYHSPQCGSGKFGEWED